MAGHGPFGRQQRWSTWWIVAWIAVAVVLVAGVFFAVPFWSWLPAAIVLFGGMEGYGLVHPDDPYPPLTDVIREYLPRWLAFLLIYAGVGFAAGTWLHYAHRYELALLGALLGWLTAHFDVIFDAAATQFENRKYAWYADRLHLGWARERLDAARRARQLNG
jgi:hypothetical protein